MKRSTLVTILTAPLWVPAFLLGVVCAVASWPFRGTASLAAWALGRTGDWLESLDDRNTKSHCVDSTGAVYVIENGVVRRTNPEDAR